MLKKCKIAPQSHCLTYQNTYTNTDIIRWQFININEHSILSTTITMEFNKKEMFGRKRKEEKRNRKLLRFEAGN